MDENNNVVATNNQIQTLPNPNGYGQYQVRDYGPPAPYYDGNDTSGDLAKGGIIGFIAGTIVVGGIMAVKTLKNKFKSQQVIPPYYNPAFGQNVPNQPNMAPPQNGGLFDKYDQMRQQVVNPYLQNVPPVQNQQQAQQVPPQNVPPVQNQPTQA